MTVVKGRSCPEEERNIIEKGFEDIINILISTQENEENNLKAKLYDIYSDVKFDSLEKKSLSERYLQSLCDIDEKYIRIRKSIFIGLYSYWEISLLDLCSTYKMGELKRKNEEKRKLQKNNCKKKNLGNLGTKDYLKLLGYNLTSDCVNIIETNLKELRNYFVHGSLNDMRKKRILSLIEHNPEFKVKFSDRFYIAESTGLLQILYLIKIELYKIEASLNNI